MANDVVEPVAPAPVVPPVVPPVEPAAVAPPVEPAAAGDDVTPAPGTGLPERGRMVPQKRVDALTREKWEERRGREAAEARNKELEGELQKLRTPAPAAGAAPVASPAGAAPAAPAALATPVPAARTDAGIDKLIDARADQKLAAREFNQKCNTTFDSGKKEFPEFEENMKNFAVFGGLDRFPVFTEAVVNLEGGHKVLNHLGQNLEEAERILSLSPVSQAIELTKLAGKLNVAAGPTISKVPAPVAPIRGTTPSNVPEPDEDGDFKSQEDFRQYRKAHSKKK